MLLHSGQNSVRIIRCCLAMDRKELRLHVTHKKDVEELSFIISQRENLNVKQRIVLNIILYNCLTDGRRKKIIGRHVTYIIYCYY